VKLILQAEFKDKLLTLKGLMKISWGRLFESPGLERMKYSEINIHIDYMIPGLLSLFGHCCVLNFDTRKGFRIERYSGVRA